MFIHYHTEKNIHLMLFLQEYLIHAQCGVSRFGLLTARDHRPPLTIFFYQFIPLHLYTDDRLRDLRSSASSLHRNPITTRHPPVFPLPLEDPIPPSPFPFTTHFVVCHNAAQPPGECSCGSHAGDGNTKMQRARSTTSRQRVKLGRIRRAAGWS